MFGLKLGLPRKSSPKAAPEVAPEAPTLPKSSGPRLSPIASAVVLAAGAGVAFWWWTQWAQGRAEAEADLADADGLRTDADGPKDVE
jgi:uncharacterized protein HemX